MVTLTDKDRNALREKLNNPESQVICPRCGNEILFKRVGNSISIECKTSGCLCGGVRGI